MNKKLIAILVVVVIILSVFLFVTPTSATSVIETPFGKMRVEVIVTDFDGNEEILDPTDSPSELEYRYGGQEVQYITVNLYTTATGEGYEQAEFDMTQVNHLVLKIPQSDPIVNAVMEWNGPDFWSCNLNEETLFRTEVWDLHNYIPYFDPTVDHIWSVKIDYHAPDFTFRGILPGGETGPWDSYDASFTLQSGMVLEWIAEYCGDGECNYGEDCYNCEQDCGGCCGNDICDDNENCWDCPGDCGSCDTWVIQQDFNVVGPLTRDVCSPRLHRYDPDTGWEEWHYYHLQASCDNLPQYTVPFYINPFGPQTAFQVYVWTQAAGVLTATCTMTSPTGVVKQLYYTSWSDVDENGLDVTANNWYSIGFWTGCSGCTDPHLIDEDGDWDLSFDITLSADIMYTLTVEPQDMLIQEDEAMPVVTCNGITDSYYPYEFELWGNQNYIVNIDWYGNHPFGEGKTTSSHSVYLALADLTYEAPHPDGWLIYATAVPYTNAYDWCIYNPTVGMDCSYVNMLNVYFWNQMATSYPYTIYCTSPTGETQTQEADITQGNDEFLLFSFYGLQILPIGTFQISGLNNFGKYIHGENYLGVL